MSTLKSIGQRPSQRITSDRVNFCHSRLLLSSNSKSSLAIIINIIPVICVQEPPEKVQTLTPTQTRRVCSVPAASTSTAKAGAGGPSTRPRQTPRGRASPGAEATTATTHTTSWTTEQAKIFVLCREDRVYVLFIHPGVYLLLNFYRD